MTKKLWGGRFKKEIDKDFFEFQKSIKHDFKLAEYDIYHSLIHVCALREAHVLEHDEWKRLTSSLKEILTEIEDGKFRPDLSSEDIHTEIQNRMENRVGPLALKLHALRSRNDQVAFDERYYCLAKSIDIATLTASLTKSLVFLAKNSAKEKFIGYTHTQRAQVIYFLDYIISFFSMFERDANRLSRFFEELHIGIGAGALTGSTLSRDNYNKAINKSVIVGQSKKIKPSDDPLGNVSDRDFVIEFLSTLSVLQMHLSRLAEDLILYSTKEFNFIDLPEEFCTGSSLMPHKKNPDFLELVRGNTGKIYGNLMSILTTMKGLPLTYNRDMQLDKEPLFSSVETIESELKIMSKFIKGIKLNTEVIKKALEDESLYATELAEFLVFKGVPFKDAHTLIGRLIRDSYDKNKKIKEMPDEELKEYHQELDRKVIQKVMNPEYAVKSKKTFSRRIPKINARFK